MPNYTTHGGTTDASNKAQREASLAGQPCSADSDYKVFHGRYHVSGSYGWFRDLDVVVVAENKSQAHTWAVMQYQDTTPSEWEFEEIDTTKPGCTWIYERES